MLLLVLPAAVAGTAVDVERRPDAVVFRQGREEYEVAVFVNTTHKEIGLVLSAVGPRGERVRVVPFTGDDDQDTQALLEAAEDVAAVLDELPQSLAVEPDLVARIRAVEDPSADLRLVSNESLRVCTGGVIICGAVGGLALGATYLTAGAAAPIATTVTTTACGAGMGACMDRMLSE
jgi:hypothetical protein